MCAFSLCTYLAWTCIHVEHIPCKLYFNNWVLHQSCTPGIGEESSTSRKVELVFQKKNETLRVPVDSWSTNLQFLAVQEQVVYLCSGVALAFFLLAFLVLSCRVDNVVANLNEGQRCHLNFNQQIKHQRQPTLFELDQEDAEMLFPQTIACSLDWGQHSWCAPLQRWDRLLVALGCLCFSEG